MPVLVVAAVLGVVFWAVSARRPSLPNSNLPVTLNLWGMEEEDVFRPTIAAFLQSHPKVQVSYTKQSLLNYRTRLQTQLQAGQGPDVFPIHSSWLPMFSGDLAVVPEDVISEKDFNRIFYPVAAETLIVKGKIFGLPKEVNGLALYVNTDILQAAGVKTPSSWQEFIDGARKMTVRNTSGQIVTSGAAMGTAANVDFWPEILATLFLQQPDVSLITPANTSGSEILQFYTNFVTDPRNKTWDVTLLSSTRQFTDGKLAFYFAPYTAAQTIQAANPNLHFKIVPMPQLPGRQVSYGGFWALSVSAKSRNQKDAWELTKYLELADILQAQNLIRPYPRTDMAGLQSGDPILGAYIAQAPYYKSWYLNSDTQDAGLNDEMIKLYAQAVNDVLQGGKDPMSSLQAIQPEIQKVLDKYGVGK